MEIRRAEKGDFESVYVLFTQLWTDLELDKEALRTIFNVAVISETDLLLCALSEGRVAGFCSGMIAASFWNCGKSCYISSLIVDEAYRNKRIGAALVRAVEDMAKRQGCVGIELDSAFHREAAHKFYEGLGYDKTGFAFSKKL